MAKERLENLSNYKCLENKYEIWRWFLVAEYRT